MRFYKIIYLVFYFLFFCTSVHTANHYVDKNASGSNDGTSWTNAWESFSDIEWNQIQPGDVIYISGGTDSTVYYETLDIQDIQGTAANPITIIAGKYASDNTNHSGRVIIDCEDEIRRESIYAQGGQSTSIDYVTLKGFELKGGTYGIHIEDYANVIVIDSMLMTEWYSNGAIRLNGRGGSVTFDGIDSVTIKNCTMISFEAAGDGGRQTDGIFMKANTNTVIHDNYIHIRNQHPTAHVDGIQSQWGQGYVIYNNVIISDSVNSPEGGGMPIILRGSGVDYPVIIYNNFLYMGGIWQDGASWSTCLNTHRGDISQYAKDPPPTYIFHNTIITNGYQVTGVGLEYFGLSWDGVFLNNIVSQYGDGAGGHTWLDGISVSSTVDVDSVRNNLHWREWGDVEYGGNWTNGSITRSNFGWLTWTNTLGGTGVNAQPLFIDNYGYEPDQGTLDGELQSNSPAINQGEDLQPLLNYIYDTYGITIEWEDINGNPRDSTPDIGAYEYIP